MSSQEEEDVQDDYIDEYTGDYSSPSSNNYEQKYESHDVYERVAEDEKSDDKSDDKSDIQVSVQESISKPHKIEIDHAQYQNFNATDEDLVKLCMQKASKINEKITNQRKILKDQFKEFVNNTNAARNNIKDYDMPYQTAHFPLYLKTVDKFVVLPAQNLNIRKGTVEAFIKTNLENEQSVKKAEQDRRVAFKQRRPYQRRKLDP